MGQVVTWGQKSGKGQEVRAKSEGEGGVPPFRHLRAIADLALNFSYKIRLNGRLQK